MNINKKKNLINISKTHAELEKIKLNLEICDELDKIITNKNWMKKVENFYKNKDLKFFFEVNNEMINNIYCYNTTNNNIFSVSRKNLKWLQSYDDIFTEMTEVLKLISDEVYYKSKINLQNVLTISGYFSLSVRFTPFISYNIVTENKNDVLSYKSARNPEKAVEQKLAIKSDLKVGDYFFLNEYVFKDRNWQVVFKKIINPVIFKTFEEAIIGINQYEVSLSKDEKKSFNESVEFNLNKNKHQFVTKDWFCIDEMQADEGQKLNYFYLTDIVAHNPISYFNISRIGCINKKVFFKKISDDNICPPLIGVCDVNYKE